MTTTGSGTGTGTGTGTMVAVTTYRADPLNEAAPALDAGDLQAILAHDWDVHGALTPLHGERDLNFRVEDPSGKRYLLKVSNPADSVDVVDFQVAAARHIRRVSPGIRISDVVPTRSGAAWTATTDANGRRCQLRLMTFLEGHHPAREDLGEDDLFAWGRAAASLGRALRGFFHPAAGYAIAWDLKRLPELKNWADALDAEPRRAVLEVISRHEEHVAPLLPAVRAQVIHNDLSRGNVLVDDRHRISGITDFGDLTHTALVCDLAVAIADVLDGRADCLRLAESMIAGYASVTPLEQEEAALLADLVAGRCVASLVIPAYRERQEGLEPRLSTGSWAFLTELRTEGLDRVAVRFASAARQAPRSRRRTTGELRDLRGRTLGPLSLSYQRPVHLVAGSGVELYGADGTTYIDAYNNVPVLGHSHPAVSAAVTAQIQLLNTNSRYLQEAPVELAERLLETMPDLRLDRVLFVNSGSEANDLAWRIACFATGQQGGIVTEHAYHGVTSATVALSPESWPPGHPPHIRLVDPPHHLATALRTVRSAAAELAECGPGLAAMFVDGVFTSDGVLGPAHTWTKDALAAVRAAGGLYVADEVQAGYGRTGDHLWSFAAGGLEPDLVTLGKPMGNGFPVAAVLGRADLIDGFMEETGYFSTFGGNTVACATALAVLRAVQEENLTDNARVTGAHLTGLLADLASQDATLAPPRGWGLAVGVDVRSPDDGLPAPDVASRLVERMRDRGVLIGLTGAMESTLKIRPPLVFTASHAERLVTELSASLRDVAPPESAAV
jgi:4-aminobutyrate aminotransferase-like enzyme/Ser/Thr protein kinase RdoA (MazF antagonist)